MKVILLKDVAKIGRRFEVVVVPDGFALNKLIPKNMAKAATPENLKRIQNLSSKMEHDKKVESAAFIEAVKTLKEVQVPVAVDANPEGTMFQALKADAIVAAVAEATSLTIDVEDLVMETPIKSLGEHVVKLVSGDVHGELTLHVIAKSK